MFIQGINVSLSTSQIKKIAHLARLAMTDEQATLLKPDLQNTLALIDKMQQTDTQSVVPLAHPLDETQPLRHDQVTETNQREQLQAIAPDIEAGLYMVPQVIESE